MPDQSIPQAVTPSPEAGHLVATANAALAKLLAEKLAAGHEYSTMRNGKVVFVHPDSTVRTGRDPSSPVAD